MSSAPAAKAPPTAKTIIRNGTTHKVDLFMIPPYQCDFWKEEPLHYRYINMLTSTTLFVEHQRDRIANQTAL
jgi:hypothetical protein